MPRRASRRYLSRLSLAASLLLCALLLSLFLARNRWIRQLVEARLLRDGWTVSMAAFSSSRTFTQIAIEHLALDHASDSALAAKIIIPDLWLDIDPASLWTGPLRIRQARIHIDSLDLQPAPASPLPPSIPPARKSPRRPLAAQVGLLDFKLRSVVVSDPSERSQQLLLHLHEPALRDVRIPEDLVDLILTACLQHGIVLPTGPRPPVKSAP